MTIVENERLAVVETKVDSLQVTVAALDTKLDSVLIFIAGQKATGAERRREGDRYRWLASIGLPAVISLVGFVAGRLLH